jgi:hypothetical protein
MNRVTPFVALERAEASSDWQEKKTRRLIDLPVIPLSLAAWNFDLQAVSYDLVFIAG